MSDEEKFEFPLWKLIKQRAREKDISYTAAQDEVLPEYVKTIRYRDAEFEKQTVDEGVRRFEEIAKREKSDIRF